MNGKNSLSKSITVIGGGPSGMMAAISAARQGAAEVKILEKNDFLGRKLLATGNGRCNLTNLNCSNANQTLDLFSEMGLLTRAEAEGRVYPYSEQASAVQEILLNELLNLGVTIWCGKEVQKIEKTDSGFQITINIEQNLYSEAIILATGGKAGPQYGATGDGYRYAKAFGHTIIRTMPSLVQFVSDSSFFRTLKGVRAKGTVELLREGKSVDHENGEIQFTEDGLSGICILNLSKNYLKGDSVRIDLLPEYSEEALNDFFAQRIGLMGNRLLTEFLTGVFHKKLIPVLIMEAALDESKTADRLTRDEIIKMVRLFKGWEISITGTKGWKEAQVTAGGV
ncbi:MAG: aminoacetone oxidase family FAD-binding enzyme, partial [Bacillota bacterium]